MLHRLVHHRRLIAFGVTLATLALPTLGSARADTAQVTVVLPGGTERTLSLQALAGSEDVVERTYELRSTNGSASQTVTGFSLAALIDAAGADPYTFSYLEVQRPAGGSVLLSRDQALSAGAAGEGPPVVFATETGTGFIRPVGGPEDNNGPDSFEAPQGITVVMRKGAFLRVRALASPLRTKPGKPVSFGVQVDRAGAGETLSYSWYFDDGRSATGAAVRHSFAKRGSYDVVLGVRASGEDAGVSSVVTIQVGAPLPGPDREGGGRNDAPAAPDHGSADGPATGSPEGSGETGTVAPPPQSAAPEPAVQPEPAPRPERKPQPAIPPKNLVEGELLGAESAAALSPATEKARQAAARRGQLSEDGSGAGVPAAAWGGLTTLGLLAAGAALEAGGLFALRRRFGIGGG